MARTTGCRRKHSCAFECSHVEAMRERRGPPLAGCCAAGSRPQRKSSCLRLHGGHAKLRTIYLGPDPGQTPRPWLLACSLCPARDHPQSSMSLRPPSSPTLAFHRVSSPQCPLQCLADSVLPLPDPHRTHRRGGMPRGRGGALAPALARC